MPLDDYKHQMERCIRCSRCKHVPYLTLTRVDRTFRTVCPSIERFNFHSFSAGGRVITAYSLLLKRIEYSPTVIDIVFQCQLCGACDVSCKIERDLEPLETMLELRSKCIEDGHFPVEFIPLIESLRKEDNTMQKPKSERGKWADGLDVKKLPEEKAEVLFHAGCRFSFDEELWPIARTNLMLLKEAGVDVGIFGSEEACCGGRAYELGFQGDFVTFMKHNIEAFKNAGVKTIVTPCADCYATFKAWYSRFGHKEFEILHSVEYIERLINAGRIKLAKDVSMRVTYHDPCHLGRLSESYSYTSPGKPYITLPKKIHGMYVYDPPKLWRRGAKGVYEQPRSIIRSIPGLRFIEMYRIKEYSWCCGAGGGVKEAYPDFAIWTAKQRIFEAESIGVEAIVTACGWCEKNLRDAVREMNSKIKIFDICELIQMSKE